MRQLDEALEALRRYSRNQCTQRLQLITIERRRKSSQIFATGVLLDVIG